MVALDTSVLARFVLRDNPAEWQVAVDLIAGNACSVSWSVLVELSWVLGSIGLPRNEIAAAFNMISEIEGVAVPDEAVLAWAIGRYAQGADFADMIHLVSAMAGSTSFASFDRKLHRQAGPDMPLTVVTLRA